MADETTEAAGLDLSDPEVRAALVGALQGMDSENSQEEGEGQEAAVEEEEGKESEGKAALDETAVMALIKHFAPDIDVEAEMANIATMPDGSHRYVGEAKPGKRTVPTKPKVTPVAKRGGKSTGETQDMSKMTLEQRDAALDAMLSAERK